LDVVRGVLVPEMTDDGAESEDIESTSLATRCSIGGRERYSGMMGSCA